MAFKMVAEMSGPEVVSEAESLARYMESCCEIGQGINSKETVRFRQCLHRMVKERLERPEVIAEIEIRAYPEQARFESMLVHLYKCGTTREEMQALFA